MSDLNNYLTDNFANAFDRFEAHARDSSPQSIEDIKRMYPLTLEMALAQWAANLDIKTKHALMKSSIDSIR